ncbi:midnolin isoform X2 [Chelonus insularis]|uniref:midnolin isoform X2 n=1 Tax=Chelonus insularis TaxID=460826 RepID=UPI00158C0775|nr:midnolin isoform X2 [Chelonus insularis]
MDGSSKQPSTDVTAMDGSGNNKSTNGDNNHRTNNNNPESETESSTSSSLAASGESEYCAAGSSSAMATMTTSSGTRSSSFAMPTSIPPSPPGCGCIVMGPPTTDPEEITISITPTTGGQFELVVERNDTIENLKKIISKRLKVAKERICLLHRERQLREGTLKENHLQDGSRLTLLPSVETGLMGQRPEQSVMQALESLNDSQVNDFLSGKAPLNLTMRLGDQMMLIQLQLSTVTPASPPATSVDPSAGVAMSSNPASSSSSSSSPTSSSSSPSSSLPSSSSSPSISTSSSSSSPCENTTPSSSIGNSTSSTSKSSFDPLSMSSLHKNLSDHLVRSMRITKQYGNTPAGTSALLSSLASAFHACCRNNLSTAMTTTNPSASERVASSPTSSSTYSRPSSPSIASRLRWHNHLVHLRHRHNHHHYHHHHHHHHHSRKEQASTSCKSVQTSTSSLTSLSDLASSPTTSQDTSSTHCTPPKKKLCTMGHHHLQADMTRSPDCDSNPQSPSNSIMGLSTSSKVASATLDTRALAEASRNLTQKLKQLSSEENARRRQGAIIESMHHHGKGVYSGTFSGTLNPALQDRHGRPKRDISTIIHILNDLLCATPAASASHYRHHHRHTSNRQQSSTSSSNSTSIPCGSISPSGSYQDSSTPGYSMEELSRENEATKGKMRRLRLVMEQRRAKRKARRQARAAPYTTQWAALTPDPNHDPNTTSGSSSASGTNPTEPQNEPELQPCSPEPVVA